MSRIGHMARRFRGKSWDDLVVLLPLAEHKVMRDQIVLAMWSIHEPEMISYLERLSSQRKDKLSREEIDSILADSFTRFYRHIDKPISTPQAWIRTIVKSAYEDHQRKQEIVERQWNNLEAAEIISIQSGMSHRDPQFDNVHLQDPLSILVEEEERMNDETEARLWFLKSFTDEQRGVFLDSMDLGLSYLEISKKRRIPEAKVDDILRLVRRKIRWVWGERVLTNKKNGDNPPLGE